MAGQLVTLHCPICNVEFLNRTPGRFLLVCGTTVAVLKNGTVEVLSSPQTKRTNYGTGR